MAESHVNRPHTRSTVVRAGRPLAWQALALGLGLVTAPTLSPGADFGLLDDPAPTPSEMGKQAPPENPAPQPTEPTTPDPKADPAMNVPGVTKVLEEQQRRPDPAAPISPVGANSSTPDTKTITPGAIPGLSLNSVALPRRKMYPEGTFLQSLGGSIVHAPGGEAIFVPDGPTGSRREPPMVLLPCATLDRLEGSAESTGGVNVSGQVFLYMGRQYLLPTNFTVRRAAATTPTTPTPRDAAATSGPASAAASPEANAADVTELIKDLDARRSERRSLQPAREEDLENVRSAAKSGEGDERTPALRGLVNEGTLIHDRRARFTRIDGEPAISFDGDAQSPADPPMFILRCRSLQRLEETIAKRGENLSLAVSGRVMVYAGRNYFLPTLVQIEPGSDVRPLQ